MRVTTGGKPRKQITDKEHIERLQKLCSLVEQDNIRLREQVKNLSEATVKRSELIKFHDFCVNTVDLNNKNETREQRVDRYLKFIND